MKSRTWLVSVAFAGGLVAQHSASADMVLPLTSTVINQPPPTPENYVVLSTLNTAPTVSPTVTYDLGDTFNQSGSTSTASDFGSSASGSGGPWNFQDNFNFSTTGATIHGTEIAFQTDLTHLQARIISQSGVDNSNGKQLIGGGGVVTIINGWTNFTAGPVDWTVLMPALVQPGNYILQIRGEAATPGSYGGTLTFDPVPLPAALPLLLSGLAGLYGFFGRRRHPSVAAG